MGWATEDYRYEQYRNAAKKLDEHGCGWIMSEFSSSNGEHKNPRYAVLVEAVQPRTDFSLLRTMGNALREVLDMYESKTVYKYNEQEETYECMGCGSVFRVEVLESYCSDGGGYCPLCGREFVPRERANKFGAGGNLE